MDSGFRRKIHDPNFRWRNSTRHGIFAETSGKRAEFRQRGGAVAERGKGRSVLIWALIAILGVIGLILLGGGAVLIGEGGSPYYLLAGLAVLASAYGLVKRRGLAMIA